MKIGVIGAGNWGTALASLLAGKGFNVTIWAFEAEVAKGINQNHCNPFFLSKLKLPKALKATNDIGEAACDKEMIVFAVPSHVTRTIVKKISPHINSKTVFVSCTKGIETETGKLISDILQESLTELPADNLCFLSGPSFANEVAKNLPTMVAIAGKSPVSTKFAQDAFRTDFFMPFTSDDIIGVQVGGAVKNVIAIACGISDGLGYGNNTRAATITRGLYEMMKIGKALGASPITFSGLAGIGDLILTCTSDLSRNRQFGFLIGEGKDISKKQQGAAAQVAEGVITSKAIFHLIGKYNISAPICTEVYRILHEKKRAEDAVADLIKMERNEELRGVV
jgi:glycerol-3-phosphate dehydrogenase (NAD(P)+)